MATTPDDGVNRAANSLRDASDDAAGPLLYSDAKRKLLDAQACLKAAYERIPREDADLRERVRTAHNALNDARWALGEYDADRSPVTGGFESAEALTAHLSAKVA